MDVEISTRGDHCTSPAHSPGHRSDRYTLSMAFLRL